jgi:pyrrolidone-carboxylate peptidase
MERVSAAAPAAAVAQVAPPIVHHALAGHGAPLAAGLRAEIEPRFRSDFSHVRVHDDRLARDSARAVGALAYTVGSHIVLGAGPPSGPAGRELLLHELAHVSQQRGPAGLAAGASLPLGRPGDAHESEADHAARAVADGRTAPRLTPRGPAVQRQVPPSPPRLHPENFPTYEQWIATFSSLPTFTARDTTPGGQQPTGFQVLGADPPAVHGATSGPTAAVPPFRPQAADRFIDHPTDAWVQANLPDELRTVAYLLPADCADVAIVLRHVWLFYQGRVETYVSGTRRWRIGRISADQSVRKREIFDLIVNEVYSANVVAMVSPYRSATGGDIRSFAGLQPLLHVGDVLVWTHHEGTSASGRRVGGHTQTIESVERDRAASITRMTLLQGNQPIDHDQATEIRASGVTESEKDLRNAPGRRIERATITQGPETSDEGGVWTEHSTDSTGHQETTTLLAAGPPQSSSRPAAAGRTRALTDWTGRFRGLPSAADLQANLESALQEARATIESGGTVSDGDARAVATAAGERLWALAKAAHDLGNASHYEPLYRMRATIRALGGISPVPAAPNPRLATLQALFRVFDDQFELAARGATTIGFGASVAGHPRVLRVLVTGFDPFDRGGSATAPAATRWNPAGAAALALDGQTETIDARTVAAIQTVVLPVSFAEFEGGGGTDGIVERIVRPLAASVDAVITVSEDPGIRTGQVRIEQFAVGVHDRGPLTPHRLFPTETVPATAAGSHAIPPAGGGGPLGPAIIESNAPVAAIAAQTADPAHGVTAPAIGPPGTPATPAQVVIQFDTAAEAQRAARLLGVPAPAPGDSELELTSPAAVEQVMRATTGRLPQQQERIQLRLHDPVSQRDILSNATVVSGPAGSFLSNEVAYRTQRLLQARGAQAPMSFHVHTQGAGATDAPGQNDIRQQTIRTLQRIVRAVGLELVRGAAAAPAAPSRQPAAPQRHP